MAEKAGDVAQQAKLGEEMAAIQGKLNASVPGPYMTPGGGAKYADRLLVTAGQFGVEIKGSKRALFDDIAGLLERARLEKDKPALEKAVPLLEGAKGQLNQQLGEIFAGAKKNATEYLKDPTYAGFTEKTLATIAQQISRIGGILLRKELPAEEPKP